MNLSQKTKVDRFDYVPNANVNNDGNANVNDSNVDNDNAARLRMREQVYWLVLRAYAFEPAAKHTPSFR